MKRFLLLLPVLAATVLPGIALADPPHRGVIGHAVGISYAAFCPGTVCHGDLMDCPEVLVVAKGRLTFADGICRDGSLTPCAGKLTFLEELCIENFTGAGNIAALSLSGKSRGCFDEGATSDCSGATPVGTVISEATNIVQDRETPTAASSIDEGTVTQGREFTFAGKKVRLFSKGNIIVGENLIQPDVSGDGCGGIGCGFASTMLSSTLK